jgi:hypothetical protein
VHQKSASEKLNQISGLGLMRIPGDRMKTRRSVGAQQGYFVRDRQTAIMITYFAPRRTGIAQGGLATEFSPGLLEL